MLGSALGHDSDANQWRTSWRNCTSIFWYTCSLYPCPQKIWASCALSARYLIVGGLQYNTRGVEGRKGEYIRMYRVWLTRQFSYIPQCIRSGSSGVQMVISLISWRHQTGSTRFGCSIWFYWKNPFYCIQNKIVLIKRRSQLASHNVAEPGSDFVPLVEKRNFIRYAANVIVLFNDGG